MSTVSQIRPVYSFVHLGDAGLLARLYAVLAGMTGNLAFSKPPVDLAVFKAAIDAYAAAIADALDGSKKAIAERERIRRDVIDMLRLLGSYVQFNCKGDMSTFLSSGFQAASTSRIGPQPLPQPGIVRVDQGNTGQLLVSIKPLPKARSYELKYALLVAGGTPGEWTTIILTGVKQPAPINGLMPGATYTFEVRALGKLGFTDWSDSASRMCI